MTTDHEAQRVRLRVGSELDVDEVVLGFRDDDGELHELASLSPPVTATLETEVASDGSVSIDTGSSSNLITRR